MAGDEFFSSGTGEFDVGEASGMSVVFLLIGLLVLISESRKRLPEGHPGKQTFGDKVIGATQRTVFGNADKQAAQHAPIAYDANRLARDSTRYGHNLIGRLTRLQALLSAAQKQINASEHGLAIGTLTNCLRTANTIKQMIDGEGRLLAVEQQKLTLTPKLAYLARRMDALYRRMLDQYSNCNENSIHDLINLMIVEVRRKADGKDPGVDVLSQIALLEAHCSNLISIAQSEVGLAEGTEGEVADLQLAHNYG